MEHQTRLILCLLMCHHQLLLLPHIGNVGQMHLLRKLAPMARLHRHRPQGLPAVALQLVRSMPYKISKQRPMNKQARLRHLCPTNTSRIAMDVTSPKRSAGSH